MFTTIFTFFAKYAIVNKIKATAAFVIKHWRVILPLLILGYCLYQYNAQVNRADAAIQALNEHISADNTARAERDRENLQKDKESGIAMAKVLADHAVSLAKHNLQRDRETKNLKDLYEKRNEQLIGGVNFNWSERVRLEQERQATAGLSGIQTPAGGVAESLRDCDAAYTTLERACKITTIDYNTLWTAWDKECQVKGCE
jgi:hypothetical protein